MRSHRAGAAERQVPVEARIGVHLDFHQQHRSCLPASRTLTGPEHGIARKPDRADQVTEFRLAMRAGNRRLLPDTPAGRLDDLVETAKAHIRSKLEQAVVGQAAVARHSLSKEMVCSSITIYS